MSWHEGFPVCELRWNDGKRLHIASFYKKGFAGRATRVRCHGWRMSWPFCFSLSLKGVVQKMKCSLLVFLVLFAHKRTFKQTKREKRTANKKERLTSNQEKKQEMLCHSLCKTNLSRLWLNCVTKFVSILCMARKLVNGTYLCGVPDV